MAPIVPWDVTQLSLSDQRCSALHCSRMCPTHPDHGCVPLTRFTDVSHSPEAEESAHTDTLWTAGWIVGPALAFARSLSSHAVSGTRTKSLPEAREHGGDVPPQAGQPEETGSQADAACAARGPPTRGAHQVSLPLTRYAWPLPPRQPSEEAKHAKSCHSPSPFSVPQSTVHSLQTRVYSTLLPSLVNKVFPGPSPNQPCVISSGCFCAELGPFR